jgi:hypothetical protein
MARRWDGHEILASDKMNRRMSYDKPLLRRNRSLFQSAQRQSKLLLHRLVKYLRKQINPKDNGFRQRVVNEWKPLVCPQLRTRLGHPISPGSFYTRTDNSPSRIRIALNRMRNIHKTTFADVQKFFLSSKKESKKTARYAVTSIAEIYFAGELVPNYCRMTGNPEPVRNEVISALPLGS